MIGNGQVRFGGGPSGKGPATLEPRPTAYPAKVTDPQALADIGPVPDHETLIEIPEDVLKFYVRRHQDEEGQS